MATKVDRTASMLCRRAGCSSEELAQRVIRAETALRELHAATDPWIENAPPGEEMTAEWAATFSRLSAARVEALAALNPDATKEKNHD
jgi:hypothetical protein